MSVTTEVDSRALGDLAERLPAPGTVDVTIEVVGEDLGDQVEVQSLPWHALVYDEVGDVIELSVGGRGGRLPVVLRHQIHHPSSVWIEEEGGSVRAISIEQRGEPTTIVSFHERPALEPGS